MTKSPSYNDPIKPSVGGSGQFSNFVLTVVLPGRRWARAWHRAGALSWNEELLLLLPGLILQRNKLGEGTLHLLLLIFNTPSKKLSSWVIISYSSHVLIPGDVWLQWPSGGGEVWWRPDSCQLSLSPLYDTSCWAGLGCNQHLQHSVSSISINSLHFTGDTELEMVGDYIYINPQRCSQLVSVTQSGSYAIMHQKVAYLREKKAPNSFTHRNSWQVSKIRH